MYFIRYNPGSENERKRIEYLLTKWEKGVKKVPGSIIVVDEGSKSFITELESKIEDGELQVYSVKDVRIKLDKEVNKSKMVFPGGAGSAWLLLSYMMAKNKAKILRNEESIRVYRVIGRKGKANVIATGSDLDGKYTINLEIKGNPEMVDYLSDHFKKEEMIRRRLRP